MKDIFSQILLNFPSQFTKALAAAQGVKVGGDFDKLVICGMGGSALPADILRAYLASQKIKLPVFISRDYHLPRETDQRSLIFLSSYSGNTEETLSCYQEAKVRGLKMVGFAAGGRLLELCQRDRTPFVQYPPEVADFQPRLASGYIFGAITAVLVNSGLLPTAMLSEIGNLTNRLRPAEFEKAGHGLAKKTKGLTPIFYAGPLYGESVARICKIQVNENAKTPAFWNVFPELNHNEMVGFTHPVGRYHLIIFQDKNDNPRIIKRIKITAQLLKQKGLLVSLIEMTGESVLEKIFNSLLIGAWLSYYLAREYRIDPLPVEMVEKFKRKMLHG